MPPSHTVVSKVLCPAGIKLRLTLSILSQPSAATPSSRSTPVALFTSYTVPLIRIFEVSQIMVSKFPIASGKKLRLTVTILSQPFAACPIKVSDPVVLFSSYTVPFTVILPPSQTIVSRVACEAAMKLILIARRLSQPFAA